MSTKLKIRKAYEYGHKSTVDTGPGLTEQAHKKECDMNYILKDYRKTGLIRHAKEYQGKYDDVSVQDFQEAMFTVKNAQNMFNELPADIRQRFGNDPGAFLGFVQNPDNKTEMEKMGILKGNDGVDVSGALTGAPVASQPQTEADPVLNTPSTA